MVNAIKFFFPDDIVLRLSSKNRDTSLCRVSATKCIRGLAFDGIAMLVAQSICITAHNDITYGH